MKLAKKGIVRMEDASVTNSTAITFEVTVSDDSLASSDTVTVTTLAGDG